MKSGSIDNSRNVVSFADLRRDATMIEVDAICMLVASTEHLIVMKTGTGCNKDLIDIKRYAKNSGVKMTTAQRNLFL
ncbi:MAG: hypothetical protein ABL858_03430 [Candidatus Nitrotoga sp.]